MAYKASQVALNAHTIENATLGAGVLVDDVGIPEPPDDWMERRDISREPVSDETRRKQSLAMMGRDLGKKHTPEARRNMSLAASKRPRRTLSLETRAKMSASHKGTTLSLETRAKISAAKKGIRQSPEAQAKRSASLKAYWASDASTRHKAIVGATRKRPDVAAKGIATLKQYWATTGKGRMSVIVKAYWDSEAGQLRRERTVAARIERARIRKERKEAGEVMVKDEIRAERMRAYWAKPETEARRSAQRVGLTNGAGQSEETRAKRSAAMRAYWADPATAHRRLTQGRRTPNLPPNT